MKRNETKRNTTFFWPKRNFTFFSVFLPYRNLERNGIEKSETLVLARVAFCWAERNRILRLCLSRVRLKKWLKDFLKRILQSAKVGASTRVSKRNSASWRSLLICLIAMWVWRIRSERRPFWALKRIFSARGPLTDELMERLTGKSCCRLQERVKWRLLLHFASEM